jgi:hypothetical protein
MKDSNIKFYHIILGKGRRRNAQWILAIEVANMSISNFLLPASISNER